MTFSFDRFCRAAAALLLAALPLAARAQQGSSQSPAQAQLLRQGDLVGGRPHASAPRMARPSLAPAPARAAVANADPVLARLLHEQVDINRVSTAALPDLYERFLAATRTQYRQWSATDWTEASAALGRLNARYEAVRQELPLRTRLDVRSAQGEFRVLEAARATKDRLNGD